MVRAGLLGVTFALLASQVFAQVSNRSPAVRAAIRKDVQYALPYILNSLSKLKCGNTHCTPATADELKAPPVDEDEAVAVFYAGQVSGLAQSCGLDWDKRQFQPMITYLSDTLHRSDRQIAILVGLYGAARADISKRPIVCSPQMRAAAEQELDFMPERLN
jgi:hypothetical protein